VPASLLSDDFHDDDRIYELIHVWRTCKDDGAPIVDGYYLVQAPNGDFPEVQIHYAIPDGARGPANANVFE